MPKQKSTAEKPARKTAAKTPAAKTAAKSSRPAAPGARAEPSTRLDQPKAALNGARATLDAPDASASLDNEELQRLIREAAYFKAKARNFAPGHEVQDWIEAESEVRLRFESGGQRQGRSA